jgi:hypothetical protein
MAVNLASQFFALNAASRMPKIAIQSVHMGYVPVIPNLGNCDSLTIPKSVSL